AIKSRDVELVQESLNVLKQSVPSIVRSWVVYDTGEVITSYNTREEYLAQLDWWQAFLASKSVHTLNPSLLNSQVLVGRPTPSENGLAVLVPIIRIATRDSDIARMLVVELDLNHALLSAADWANNPVSLYSSSGLLVARPYRYLSREPLTELPDPGDPLIRLLRESPANEMSFNLFTRDNERRAGVLAHVPSLNMAITVERSAHEVFRPLRFLSLG